MRLIDTGALIDVLNSQDLADWLSEQEEYTPASIVEHALETLPIADAEPVRYGKWTADESTYTDGEAQCSVCKTTFYVDDLYCVGEKAQSELPNYCPHCGAKMDGEHEID